MKKFLKRSFVAFCILIILGLIFVFATPPGYRLREIAAESILSSQHGYLAKYTFLPHSVLNNMKEQIYEPAYVNVKAVDLQNFTQSIVEQRKNTSLDVRVVSIKKTYSPTYYYTGELMFISNPKDVHLITSSESNWGQQINVLANRAQAIGAVNAGGFLDVDGEGNGGTPQGIVIVDGQIVHTDHGPDTPTYVSGITKDGVLVCGYYSANQLLQMGVEYAAGFRPQLIANGKKLITTGDGGWGIGPRTAIGQTKDGTIILLVIDGRQAHSIGATVREVQDIMAENGVINAMCMDGGSSSSMYFDGKLITTPSSVGNIPRWLPNAWVVVPEPGQAVTVTEDGQPVQVSTTQATTQQ